MVKNIIEQIGLVLLALLLFGRSFQAKLQQFSLLLGAQLDFFRFLSHIPPLAPKLPIV